VEGHEKTESEGMRKDIPCKWKLKESWGSYTYIRQKITPLKQRQ